MNMPGVTSMLQESLASSQKTPELSAKALL